MKNYCSKCNAMLLHDDVFCGDCGTPVVSKAAGVAAGVLPCGKCGNLLASDDMFCDSCGTPVVKQAVSAAPGGMSCSKCGQAMEMDDVFCGGCGTPFTPPQFAAPFQPTPVHQAPLPSPFQPTPVHQVPPLPHPPIQPVPIYQAPPLPPTTAPPPPQPAPVHQTAPPAPPAASVSQTRIPLVFVVDTSAATDSYLQELNKQMNELKARLSADSKVSSLLDIAIIQFGERHGLIQDFISVQRMNPVMFAASPVPDAAFDPPIREALRIVSDYNRKPGAAHKAWIVLIGGSSPIDDISSVASEVKSAQGFDALRLIALGVDKCDFSALKRLTDVVFRQDGVDFTAFFDWIEGSMKAISKTPHGQKPQLPNVKGNVYRDR